MVSHFDYYSDYIDFHYNLSKDLSLMLNDSDDYDVIIQVGENQNMKEFQAHSTILRARSPYFKSALSTRWATRKSNMITFYKPNITPTIFEMILNYIYTGEINLKKCEDILGLLAASDELLLEKLVESLQGYLIRRREDWVQQNSVTILNKVPSCEELYNFCFETIRKDPQPFITSKTLFSLNENILYSLLEQDDFQIEDDVAWDCLIKWGIEQTPGLENDESKWNDENYEALKTTLDKFIPLIRFVGISHNDFLNKVKPYKNIFPDHIYKEIEDFYFRGILPKITILPPRIGIFESKIIKPKLANIIVNWINKKDNRTINDPYYKFKLIFSNSYGCLDFKEKCDGKVANLVLIKVQDNQYLFDDYIYSEKIFGGYSSIGFNSIEDNNLLFESSKYKNYYSSDNFIFSFKDGEDTRDMKISRVVDHSRAIRLNDNDYNEVFNFGNSLYINDDGLHVTHYGSYEYNLENGIYSIMEIETFIVVEQSIHLLNQ